MGTRHLHEILSERMTISGTMQVRSYDGDDNDHPFMSCLTVLVLFIVFFWRDIVLSLKAIFAKNSSYSDSVAVTNASGALCIFYLQINVLT